MNRNRIFIKTISSLFHRKTLYSLIYSHLIKNGISRPQILFSQTLINCIITRAYRSKQESYFSAIGGDSDEPPPNLTPQQVTNILRTNEITITNSIRSIEKIECNQLAANHPVEDRLRVSKLFLKEKKDDNNTMLFAVFDGHGGGLCADVIANRLFHYVALSLLSNALNKLQQNAIENIVQDIYTCPRLSDPTRLTYEIKPLEKIRQITTEKDKEWLLKYATKLENCKNLSIEDRLKDAFNQCDNDLSQEIQQGLLNPISNILTHYYLSLAASGCCVSLLLIHNNNFYIASTGDCRAVIGFREDTPRVVIKSVDLNAEHNSDNVSEIKRLFSSHPPSETKTIIKNDRLLSYLMPFRAFGDFCYKWPVETIHKVGLTRAFGSHIIPPHYYTPPYLIAEPEVSCFPINQSNAIEQYIIMATDGLWEQFGTSRCVAKQVVKHNLKKSKPHNTNILDFVDENCCTHLLRTALSANPLDTEAHSLDAQAYFHQQHMRLVSFLTLPVHAVRNFRDDISIIVLQISQ